MAELKNSPASGVAALSTSPLSSTSSEDSTKSEQFEYTRFEDAADDEWHLMPTANAPLSDGQAAAYETASVHTQGSMSAAEAMLAALQADYDQTHATGQQKALEGNHGSTQVGFIADPEQPAALPQEGAAHPSHPEQPFDPFAGSSAAPSPVQAAVALRPLPTAKAAAVSAAMARMPALPSRPAAAALASRIIQAHGSTIWKGDEI